MKRSKKRSKNKTTITIRIDPGLKKWVKVEAKKYKMTPSRFAELAIHGYNFFDAAVTKYLSDNKGPPYSLSPEVWLFKSPVAIESELKKKAQVK